ncbi:protein DETOXIFICATION 14-like [Dioscorea cayenensis subsp. rotundata]|uniref:Protein DETOXIFICATION n=1 Tax=Dioscorea cayennensis subsp. rotundata TaxID=55577 RepID=A0AB40B6I8_DIOCR|nr:protein DETOXIFICATION 14-like [Dioscorea cayenensis subsp. rotundata]
MEDEVVVREEGQRTRWRSSEFMKESGRMAKVAGPMMLVSMSQILLQFISVVMVGHLGEIPLSATTIATSVAAVTGFSVLVGMASALDTLCGQAYGAEQYKKLATNTYSAMVSLTLVCIPLSFLWLFIDKILSVIGQDPLISHEAGKYVKLLIPSIFSYSISQPLMKFLQSQSLILPMLLSSVATLCLHLPLCWLFVFKFGFGNAGAALSINISNWTYVLVLVLYVKLAKSCERTRAPISVEAIKGVNEFMKLSLPSVAMLCLQWWSCELLVLMSGFLPNAKLETSVLSICLTIVQVMFCFPYGFGAAASTRISNELGAGNPQKARFVAYVVLCLALVEVTIVSGILFAARHIWACVFSNIKEVVDHVSRLAPFICLAVIMDCLQGIISGIARGCGWQNIGAYANLVALYLIGTPLAIVLGFIVHMRGKGIWIGIWSGATIQSISLLLITFFTNWEKQAKNAKKRIFDEKLTDINAM